MAENKNIYDLELHEAEIVGQQNDETGGVICSRVPGGWVYTTCHGPCMTSVFVPYSDEFAPKDERKDRMCSNCQHWFPTAVGKNVCRKNAPDGYRNDSFASLGVWPQTHYRDTCGDFRPVVPGSESASTSCEASESPSEGDAPPARGDEQLHADQAHAGA